MVNLRVKAMSALIAVVAALSLAVPALAATLSISGGTPVSTIPQGSSGNSVLGQAGIGIAGGQIWVDGTLDILGDTVTLTLYDVGSESHWKNQIRLAKPSGTYLTDNDNHWRGSDGDFTNGPLPGQLIGSVTQNSGVARFEFWRITPEPVVQIVVNGQSPMMMVEGYEYASIALAYLSDTNQIVSEPTNRILVLLEDGGQDRDYDDYVGILAGPSPATVTVPDVVGLTQAGAETVIVNAGLVVGTVTQQSNVSVPAGNVISQSPSATTSVGQGSAVSLVVSTGPASAAAYVLSPTSITFGDQPLKLASDPQAITLSSTGGTALSITSITLAGTNPGQFALSHTCGSSVPAGSGCVITVTFKPTSTGSKTAAVTIATASGTQTVSLSGTGVMAVYSVSPTTLAFGNVASNTTSAAQAVVISNTGTVVLPVTSITLTGTNSGQFVRTTNCPAQVPVGGSCIASVIFKPTSTGLKSASLKVTPGGGASATSVALNGTGI